MVKLNEACPDNRRMLTELRLQATKQIVTLAMASSAIPISLAGLIDLKSLDSVDYAYLFWNLVSAGWIMMGIALVSGYICISAASTWVRDEETLFGFLLEFTYYTAPICFVLGLFCFGAAAYIAIRHGTPISHH